MSKGVFSGGSLLETHRKLVFPRNDVQSRTIQVRVLCFLPSLLFCHVQEGILEQHSSEILGLAPDTVRWVWKCYFLCLGRAVVSSCAAWCSYLCCCPGDCRPCCGKPHRPRQFTYSWNHCTTMSLLLWMWCFEESTEFVSSVCLLPIQVDISLYCSVVNQTRRLKEARNIGSHFCKARM